jgi:hypothetical protein
MISVKHSGLKWIVLGCLILALVVILLSSRTASSAGNTCGGKIGMGEQVSGWIERAGAKCEYTFEGQKGQDVAITMLRVTLDDPYLELWGSARVALDENDDAATDPGIKGNAIKSQSRNLPVTRDSLLTFTLPVAGTYRILAHDHGSGTGQFLLNLCGTYIADPYMETVKKPRTASVEPGGSACYNFNAQAGDCITAAMNKGRNSTVDPWLDLKDPTGAIIASDDDSNGDSDALIRNFCVKKAGLYTIIARSYDRSNKVKGSGPFTFYFEVPRPAK